MVLPPYGYRCHFFVPNFFIYFDEDRRAPRMAPPKRPSFRVLQGEDDGEGHTWKVLRGRDGLIDIFYGRGSASKLRLRNEDKKSTPTEQLVLKRIRASC